MNIRMKMSEAFLKGKKAEGKVGWNNVEIIVELSKLENEYTSSVLKNDEDIKTRLEGYDVEQLKQLYEMIGIQIDGLTPPSGTENWVKSVSRDGKQRSQVIGEFYDIASKLILEIVHQREGKV